MEPSRLLKPCGGKGGASTGPKTVQKRLGGQVGSGMSGFHLIHWPGLPWTRGRGSH